MAHLQPQPEPPAPSEVASPRAANTGVQALGALAGAVASTVIASRAAGSPTLNLIAAIMGAALPPFATYMGPYRHFRRGLALAVIAAAIFVTYGGVTLFNVATGTKTFVSPAKSPRPDPAPEPTTTPTPTETPTPPKPGISVTPDTLRCTADGCDQPVVIKSTGSRQLRIFDIEIDGNAKDLFGVGDECRQRAIDRNSPCKFDVTFTPRSDQGTVTGRLVIHQNLDGPPTVVSLIGSGGPLPPQGDLAITDAACTLRPGPLARVTLTAAAPTGVSVVPVRLTAPDGNAENATISTGQAASLDLALTADATAPVAVTVALDPDQGIPEDDEDNNVRELSCPAP